jgi:RNA polymerase sigma-70 factor (ECF subfamily)
MAAESSIAQRQAYFERLASPLRREIKVHCYRMLGSLHDADDAVQEAYIRAWRAFESYEDGSFRAWLYRIATNTSLDALARRKVHSRVLPDQLGPATTNLPDAPALEVPWLEPYPDADIDWADEAPTPEARFSSRQAVQLAFVAAIQQLPPRQRAALLLCDVLGWSSAETAVLLGSTTASINSAMQRARETLAKHYPQGEPLAASQPDAEQQALLDRYLRVWEAHDFEGFVALLKEDATLIMPPWPQWYAGREAIRWFSSHAWKTYGDVRFVRTSANAQPAFALYDRPRGDTIWKAHSLHVLTLEGAAISEMVTFVPPTAPQLFGAFGLPVSF